MAAPGVRGFNPSGGVINSIAVAPSDPQSLYVVTGTLDLSSTHIFVKLSGDTSWHQRDVPFVQDGLTNIQVDPSNPKVA